MTSQLNVDTIVDKAGSGGSNVKMANTSTYVADGGAVTQNTVQSLCKQWVLLQSSGTSVTDSFNNASVTDNGTGDYTLTRTNNMGNATYCAIGSSGDPQTSHNASSDVGVQTTSVHDIRCVNDDATSTQDIPDTVGSVLGEVA